MNAISGDIYGHAVGARQGKNAVQVLFALGFVLHSLRMIEKRSQITYF